MICSPCGQPLENGQAAIYGVECGGRLEFGWTCCHRPVGDVAVILASEACMQKWLLENPQYVDEVGKLFEAHRKAHL